MKYLIDNRTFETTKEYTTSEEWRKAFPAVYGNMPAVVARSFALRDFNAKEDIQND